MPKLSMWWLFLVLFGLTIGGIQSLGWWMRPASVRSSIVLPPSERGSAAAALRHQNCESKHWRALFMQQ